MGIYLTGGKEGNYCHVQQVTALRSMGWRMVPDNCGPSRGRNPAHHCTHQTLEAVCATSPCAKAQVPAPSPWVVSPKGGHSYGADLSWFSCAVLRVWLAGARRPVDPRIASLELLWMLTLWANTISSQTNSLLLLHVSPVHLLPPSLGGNNGGDSQPKGSSAGHALVRHFHQALHWTGKTKVSWQGSQEALSHRAMPRLPLPVNQRVRLQQRWQESGRYKTKWKVWKKVAQRWKKESTWLVWKLLRWGLLKMIWCLLKSLCSHLVSMH